MCLETFKPTKQQKFDLKNAINDSLVLSTYTFEFSIIKETVNITLFKEEFAMFILSKICLLMSWICTLETLRCQGN